MKANSSTAIFDLRELPVSIWPWPSALKQMFRWNVSAVVFLRVLSPFWRKWFLLTLAGSVSASVLWAWRFWELVEFADLLRMFKCRRIKCVSVFLLQYLEAAPSFAYISVFKIAHARQYPIIKTP